MVIYVISANKLREILFYAKRALTWKQQECLMLFSLTHENIILPLVIWAVSESNTSG
jgi:hypothetical protein